MGTLMGELTNRSAATRDLPGKVVVANEPNNRFQDRITDQ